MNLVRLLIYDKQVSLTLADTTEIVAEGARLHKLSSASLPLYGRGMSAMTYMSACLKEESGEVSFTLQCDGEGVDMGASGNRALYLRGYIGNPQMNGDTATAERRALGKNGAFTVVRDDGYNRPFVGACAFPENADFDQIVEEYYRISEQIPTRVKTAVEIDENGNCAFAGIAVVQPLPFASQETLQNVATLDLIALLQDAKEKGAWQTAKDVFNSADEEIEGRKAIYKCNCSREYLAGVLVTLGEAQMRDIIATEGALRAHCHYCNSDYEFTNEDADRIFSKE